MENEVITQPESTVLEMLKVTATDTHLADLKVKSALPAINGIKDKAGYNKTREVRLSVWREKVEFDKHAKDIRLKKISPILEKIKEFDDETKRIIGEYESIYRPLEAEEERIDELIRDQKAQERIDKMAKYNKVITIQQAKAYKTDKDFNAALSKAVAAFQKAEAERKEKEEQEAQQKLKEQELAAKSDESLLQPEIHMEREPLNDPVIISMPNPSQELKIDPPLFESAPEYQADNSVAHTDEQSQGNISDLESIASIRSQFIEIAYPEVHGIKAKELVSAVKILVQKTIDYIDSKSIDL